MKKINTNIQMKKGLFFLSALAFVCAAHIARAQLINPGFEIWTPDYSVPSAMNPNSGNGTNGWWDYNYFNSSYFGSSPISVTRCTDTVHSGTYSARVQSVIYTTTSWNYYKSWGIPFIGHEYSDTLGILFNGYTDITTFTYRPGIPFTDKITQFSFYYQYNPNGNDTAECRVALTSSGIPVAGGAFKTGAASSGWQQAVIDITYIDVTTPDTMWVLFSASSLDHQPKPGSVLWIDDVDVTLPSGINLALETENVIEVFPNPSGGIFSIRQQSSATGKLQNVEIFNMPGEKIYSGTIIPGTSDIDISHSPKGIYFIKIYNEENIHTEKIIVQ